MYNIESLKEQLKDKQLEVKDLKQKIKELQEAINKNITVEDRMKLLNSIPELDVWMTTQPEVNEVEAIFHFYGGVPDYNIDMLKEYFYSISIHTVRCPEIHYIKECFITCKFK